MTTARRALLEKNHFRVHVVRHGNGKEEQNKCHGERGPLAEGLPEGVVPLMNPARAPCRYDARGDHNPYDIKKQFH